MLRSAKTSSDDDASDTIDSMEQHGVHDVDHTDFVGAIRSQWAGATDWIHWIGALPVLALMWTGPAGDAASLGAVHLRTDDGAWLLRHLVEIHRHAAPWLIHACLLGAEVDGPHAIDEQDLVRFLRRAMPEPTVGTPQALLKPFWTEYLTALVTSYPRNRSDPCIMLQWVEALVDAQTQTHRTLAGGDGVLNHLLDLLTDASVPSHHTLCLQAKSICSQRAFSAGEAFAAAALGETQDALFRLIALDDTHLMQVWAPLAPYPPMMTHSCLLVSASIDACVPCSESIACNAAVLVVLLYPDGVEARAIDTRRRARSLFGSSKRRHENHSGLDNPAVALCPRSRGGDRVLAGRKPVVVSRTYI
jgi:hypothetical protein